MHGKGYWSLLRNKKGTVNKGYLVGEGEADGLPPLDGDGDDQEDGGGEGKVTRALQDGEHEADGVKLGSIIH